MDDSNNSNQEVTCIYFKEMLSSELQGLGREWIYAGRHV